MTTSEYAVGTLGTVAIAGAGTVAMVWWVSHQWWKTDVWTTLMLMLGL